MKHFACFVWKHHARRTGAGLYCFLELASTLLDVPNLFIVMY